MNLPLKIGDFPASHVIVRGEYVYIYMYIYVFLSGGFVATQSWKYELKSNLEIMPPKTHRGKRHQKKSWTRTPPPIASSWRKKNKISSSTPTIMRKKHPSHWFCWVRTLKFFGIHFAWAKGCPIPLHPRRSTVNDLKMYRASFLKKMVWCFRLWKEGTKVRVSNLSSSPIKRQIFWRDKIDNSKISLLKTWAIFASNMILDKSQWTISTYVPNGRNSEKVRFVRQLMVKRHPGFCVVPYPQKTRGWWLFQTIVTRSCKRHHPNLTEKNKIVLPIRFFIFADFYHRINQHVVRFMEG